MTLNDLFDEGSKNTSEHSKQSDPTSEIVDVNPYFIHHSDHSRLVLVSKLLQGHNFSGWRRAMVRALNPKNKLGFVDGSIKPPSAEVDPKGFEAWSKANDIVHSWIVNACDPAIGESVDYYPTAREAWEDLHERFSQPNATRIFEIQRDINSLQQEQLPVAAYYTKLKALWDELASLDAKLTSNQQRMMQFLMGLNETYQAIRGQILIMNPLPTVQKTFSLILQEEKQRMVAATRTPEEYGSAAMAVRTGRVAAEARDGVTGAERSSDQRGGAVRYQDQCGGGGVGNRTWNGGARKFNHNQNQRRFGSERKRPHCTYSNGLGHWVQTCHKLHGYPDGYRKPAANYASEERSISISEDQLKQLLSLIPKSHDEAGSNSQANAVTKPGSGYKEDD